MPSTFITTLRSTCWNGTLSHLRPTPPVPQAPTLGLASRPSHIALRVSRPFPTPPPSPASSMASHPLVLVSHTAKTQNASTFSIRVLRRWSCRNCQSALPHKAHRPPRPRHPPIARVLSGIHPGKPTTHDLTVPSPCTSAGIRQAAHRATATLEASNF